MTCSKCTCVIQFITHSNVKLKYFILFIITFNVNRKNDKQSHICNNNILLTSRMTQTKLNFVLAKPIKQNKNNNNSDGTPLLIKRKQHKKEKEERSSS